MPTAPPQQRDIKANGHTRRAARAHARRSRFFDAAERAAFGDPAQLLLVASRRVQSAAAHTHGGDSAVRQLADAVADQARHMAERAGMAQVSVDRSERALTAAATSRDRLAVGLRWLRTAVAGLDGDTRGTAAEGYADQLTRAARDLLGEASRKGTPC